MPRKARCTAWPDPAMHPQGLAAWQAGSLQDPALTAEAGGNGQVVPLRTCSPSWRAATSMCSLRKARLQ